MIQSPKECKLSYVLEPSHTLLVDLSMAQCSYYFASILVYLYSKLTHLNWYNLQQLSQLIQVTAKNSKECGKG